VIYPFFSPDNEWLAEQLSTGWRNHGLALLRQFALTRARGDFACQVIELA